MTIAKSASEETQRRLFAALTTQLELSIAADSEERMFQGFLQLMQMTALMRRAHQGTDEPALTFAASTIVRGNDNG